MSGMGETLYVFDDPLQMLATNIFVMWKTSIINENSEWTWFSKRQYTYDKFFCFYQRNMSVKSCQNLNDGLMRTKKIAPT